MYRFLIFLKEISGIKLFGIYDDVFRSILFLTIKPSTKILN